jgi:pimeloyl-ACP methyl ester carboxylesterase
MSKGKKDRPDLVAVSLRTRLHGWLSAFPLIRGFFASRKACRIERDRDPQEGDPVFVLIHGTWNMRAAWAKQDSHLFRELSRLWPKSGIYRFIWSATNGIRQRLVAADILSEILDEIAERYPSSPLVLIAHSHGGNVAAWASTNVKKPIAAAVYLNTPFIQALDPASTTSLFLRVVLLIGSAIIFISLAVSFQNLFFANREGPTLLFWELGVIGACMAAIQLVVPRWLKALRQRVVEYTNSNRNVLRELSTFVVGDEPASALSTVYLVQWLGQRIIFGLLFAIPMGAIITRFVQSLNSWLDRSLPYIAGGIVTIYLLYLILAVSGYGLLQGLIALDAMVTSTPAPQGRTDFVTIAWTGEHPVRHSSVHDSPEAISEIMKWLADGCGFPNTLLARLNPKSHKGSPNCDIFQSNAHE